LPPIALRFVVLHHTKIPDPHFDLMLEMSPDSPLSTWRLPHWPPNPDDLAIAITDHRREYLQFEGEISGDRGHVKRIAIGSYRLLSRENDVIQIELEEGTRMSLPRIPK
jgi:hypothetical protein